MPIECKIEKKLILNLNIEGEDVYVFKKLIDVAKNSIEEYSKESCLTKETKDTNNKMINLATLILQRFK